MTLVAVLNLAVAQGVAHPQPASDPLNLDHLDRPPDRFEEPIIRPETISQEGLTEPSLWWAAQQFGGSVLNTWLAYPEQQRIDLVINPQFWTPLDYLERYQFVHQMGLVARSHGYNLRVFNRQQPERLLAAYTCDFQQLPLRCQLDIERGGSSGLRRLIP
ncbi:hypothetical protein E1H12_04725 [Geitlerinema sp. P-1104]|nr:hypothetical protein [Geitlerinema sp. P-1104]